MDSPLAVEAKKTQPDTDARAPRALPRQTHWQDACRGNLFFKRLANLDFRKIESLMLRCTRLENMQSGFKAGVGGDQILGGDIAVAAILL
jgi:hypothetical protein